MKALVCKKFGQENNLIVEEISSPKINDEEVLIKVESAGLNFPDILCIRGDYQIKPELPFVPGGEGAGIIESVGKNVKNLSIGDKVIFTGLVGAYAEYNNVNQHAVIKMPDIMTFEDGGGFSIVYATTYYALNQKAKLKKEEILLVLGAAGGVGLAAVEIGKAMGAKVIAVASTQEKLNIAKNHGADKLINYVKDDLKSSVKEITNKNGADVIYDPVGGSVSEQAFRSIAWEGRHLVIGFAGGEIHKLPLNLPLLKGASVVGVYWGAWALRNISENNKNMSELFTLYKDKKIRPHIGGTFRLNNFKQAFSLLTKRQAIGKIIIKP